jgi:hypothetical protein
MESLTLFYTIMSFKILFQQTISLFPVHSTLTYTSFNTVSKLFFQKCFRFGIKMLDSLHFTKKTDNKVPERSTFKSQA